MAYKKTVGFRILAYYIDILIILMISIGLNLLFGFGSLDTTSHQFSYRLNPLEATVIFTAYFGMIEYLMYGQSIGKRVLKIEVRNENMAPFSHRTTYLLRGLLKGVLCLLSPISFLVVLINKNKQSIHDLLVKTIVIRKVKIENIPIT